MGDVLEFKPRRSTTTVSAGPLPPNEKRDALLRILDTGVAMVHLDARLPGVAVPAQYAGDYHLRLKFSWKYRIHDLDIGAEKVVGSLSFSGRSFRVELPWAAIFAITSESRREMSEHWLKDVPTELVQAKPDAG